ncbi:heterokaryon incompatibility protein-domain-containing protein [Xylaria sp. FL0933]|nr:heterokaryon incompatibility protein-domain-containing protein [Xylaria sp. FL0933]
MVKWSRVRERLGDEWRGFCKICYSWAVAFRWPAYRYRYLDDPNKDIRIATIIPGRYGDSIRLHIHHVVLEELSSTCSKPRRLAIDEIQKTLPDGWTAYETIEGRCLFVSDNDVTWDHPTPNVEHSFYTLDPVANQASPSGVSFEALSYVWGVPSWWRRRTVLVACTDQRGKSTWSWLKIGVNLDAALRDLRYQDQPRALWCDAICINQGDIDERNQQVKRMADIYSQASRVVVWLDQTTNNSERAINTLKRIGEHVEQLIPEGGIVRSPGDITPFHRSDFQWPLNDQDWLSIEQLVRREWFRRIWVIQEALLGGRRTILQFGQSQITWPIFCRVIESIHRNHYVPPGVLANINEAYGICIVNYTRDATTNTLIMAMLRNCSNPRDLVYGLLGILPKGIRTQIRPDYAAPTSQVYHDFTLAYIKHTRRLEIFDLCDHGFKRFPRPSWVVDPSQVEGRGRYKRIFEPYQFCAHFSECHVKASGPGVLEVLGLRISVVASTSEAVPGLNQFQSDEECFKSCIHTVRAWEPADLHEATYPSGESLLEAYAQTLICGKLQERFPTSPSAQSSKRWQGQYYTNAFFGELAHVGELALTELTSQERDPIENLIGRKLIRCDNGYIGIGPAVVNTGDLICVLLGHENPVVLRRQDSNNYTLVGVCYLHGISDGDALLGPLPKPWRVQRFLDASGQFGICRVFNEETKTLQDEDPRLEPLGSEWERLEGRPRTAEDPQVFQEFRHRVTGEVRKSDPRLSPDALRRRGVSLEIFSLI